VCVCVCVLYCIASRSYGIRCHNKCVATNCNTLQHTAVHCSTLQHTSLPHVLSYSDVRCVAVYCSALVVCCSSDSLCTLLYAATTVCGRRERDNATHCNTLQHTTQHCNTLQHTATRCNTLQHTTTHCNTLQHTATYCTILHHTAPHCNILLRCHDGLRSA